MSDMDMTLEEYLEFERHLLEQKDNDEEYEEPVYWC
jgi:hypothetical protein